MSGDLSADNHVHGAGQDFPWNRTIHQVLSSTIAIIGTILNLVAIFVLYKEGLHRQSPFKFVLNLFVSNFLMCSVCLPIISYCSFFLDADSIGPCPFYGYIIYSIVGTAVLNIVLISFNRYFLIVRFNIYHRIYTARNIRIILVVVWTFYPTLLLFPLTNLWGAFTYDNLRFTCNPLHSISSFRVFILVTTVIITVPTILFCYVEILRKVNSSFRRVASLNSGVVQRMRNDRQLVRTILVTIILFTCMNLPFIVLSILDPHLSKVDLWIHVFAIYLGWSNSMVNPLIYSTLNYQIKSSLLGIFDALFKRNPNADFPKVIAEIEIKVISVPRRVSSHETTI